MVLSIRVRGDVVIPDTVKKLYQGIIKEDGSWRTPTGALIEIYPTWVCKFEAPNKYVMTHDLATSLVSIQVDTKDPLCGYTITDINDSGFTVETRDAARNPAPCEWKFKLRENH